MTSYVEKPIILNETGQQILAALIEQNQILSSVIISSDKDYIVGLSVDGDEITYTKGDGTTGKITVKDASGTAAKATADASGNVITSVYETKANAITKLEVSGTTITYTKGNGSTGTISTQDTNTDTKVTNTLAKTTKAYVTGTTSASTNTGTQVFDTGVYLDSAEGTLVATTFKTASGIEIY